MTSRWNRGSGRGNPASTIKEAVACQAGWERPGPSSEELREALYDFLSGRSVDSLTASSSQPWASYL